MLRLRSVALMNTGDLARSPRLAARMRPRRVLGHGVARDRLGVAANEAGEGGHAGAPVGVGGKIWGVTAKEKLHKRVNSLSEQDAERLLSELEQAIGNGETDEWGNLPSFRRASSASVFRHLDEEEAKAGFSWEQYR